MFGIKWIEMIIVPKFIPADKVREKNGDGKEMYIKQFVKKPNTALRTPIYTRQLICYWFENGAVRIDIFHEDELELAKEDQLFLC